MRETLIVFRKELLEASRDRRALIAVGFSISIFPILMLLMGNFAGRIQDEVLDMEIPVEGAEHAPNLVAWLEQQPGVAITPAPSDPLQAVRDRETDVALRIPEEYREQFREARPAELELVADSSRPAAAAKANRVEELLEGYGREIGALRLVARGVSPMVATPLTVERSEVVSERRRTVFRVLSFIPMFLLMNAFMGGMQIAADSVAGERERGSIEALLLNAVPARRLVHGKWAAASVVALLLTVLGLLSCILVLRFMPGEMNIAITGSDWALVLAVALPLALLTAALQIVVAAYSKSYKEAQTYFGYMVMLPMLPFFAVTFNLIERGTWSAFIPVLGHYLMALDLVAGEPVAAWEIEALGLLVLALTLTLLRLASSLFARESVVFTR